MGSKEEKLTSREMALHLRIFLGTLASCSPSGADLKKKKKKIPERKKFMEVSRYGGSFTWRSIRGSRVRFPGWHYTLCTYVPWPDIYPYLPLSTQVFIWYPVGCKSHCSMLSNLSLIALAVMLPREWKKCINRVRASQNLMTGVKTVKRLETWTSPMY